MNTPAELVDKMLVEKKEMLRFRHLPAYAAYLLQHHLGDFAAMQLKFSHEEKVPLLKYFKHLAEHELVGLAINTARDFLTQLAENKAAEIIKKSTTDFVRDEMLTVEREQVVAEDITIISFIRRKTLRFFLSNYTSSLDVFIQVMEEVDRFIMESESATFTAYIGIQKDKIQVINNELEQRYSDLLEAQELAEMGSFFWDLANKKSVYSPGVYKIFEFDATGTMESFMQDVHEHDRPKLKQALSKALEQDGEFECEYRYTKNGKEKKIWSRGRVNFEDGKPVNMKGTIMDVTVKNKLIEKLQQSEELHKQAQAITHIGNWNWEINENRVNWSDEMFRIYGLAPQSEDITFERFLSLVHPDDREARIKEIQEALSTGETTDYTMRIVNPDGTIKILQGKGELIKDSNNEPIKLVGTCQDITREYTLNKDLQEKEAYLQQLIHNAPDAVIVIDSNSLITLWNPKTEAVFGWKSAEVIGKPLTDIIVPVQHHSAHKEGMKRLLETGVATVLNKTIELTAINRAGTEIDISLTISQSIQKGDYYFIAFLRDITKEKQIQAELNKKSEQLEHLNNALESKNAELESINRELESFNYVASHDLKEPLRKIQIFSQRILEKKEQLEPVIADDFDKILKSSARMTLLIEDLLMYSQTTNIENSFEPVDLNVIVEEVTNILFTSIEEKNAVIESSVLPVISAIPFQMQQLLLNLIGNAIKYSQDNITPHIKLSSTVVDGNNIKLPGATAKRYVQLNVEDNGIGFEDENAEKIFGLFQRLHNKEKYSGTGIGLAICQKIVNNHKGFILAKSKLYEGSIFTVYIPLINGGQVYLEQ